MKIEQVRQQKPADKQWVNEAGDRIPYDRTKPSERMNERKLATIAKDAIKLNNLLCAFKDSAFAAAKEMYEQFLAENNGKAPGKGKGGLTLYNFDRSIKVEVSVQESIEFDKNYIGLAKDKLDEMLEDGLTGSKDFVKPLVMDAFRTSGGELDTKRVLGLRRYADRITDPRYAEAMALIDKAIRRPDSKEYMRVWVRNCTNEYVNVQLNFSAV